MNDLTLEEIPAPPSPEEALNEDLLAQAGLMLQFIDASQLSAIWREYEVASVDRRAEIAYAVRMRLAPDL